MSITNTHSWSVASDNGASPITGQQSETGTALVDINQNFDIGTSVAVPGVAFAHATLKSLFIKSTKNATLVFTMTGGGTVSIALIANAPYFANPFSADVVSAAITNAVATQLLLRALN
jgi:hypothetical protein